MLWTLKKEGDVSLIQIQGRLDSLASEKLGQYCMVNIGKSPQESVILDLSELHYVSSSGLRIILLLGKKLKELQGKLIIVGVHGMVKEVINISGFHDIFPMISSLDEAYTFLGVSPFSISTMPMQEEIIDSSVVKKQNNDTNHTESSHALLEADKGSTAEEVSVKITPVIEKEEVSVESIPAPEKEEVSVESVPAPEKEEVSVESVPAPEQEEVAKIPGTDGTSSAINHQVSE